MAFRDCASGGVRVAQARAECSGSTLMKEGTTKARRAYWSIVSAIVLGGVALRAPALDANLYADDWDHYAIETNLYPVKLPIWDMFNWVGHEAAQREALLEAGRLPWWSSPDLQLSVFRPLASLVVHFDYAVLDGAHHPGRLHIHTALWWSFLLFGVAGLMASVLPLPVAVLSTLLYAVDDGFIVPFAWVANRSQIIALAFVVWALWCHVRAQRTGKWSLHCASAALVALGLCAGEHALAALAYLVAASLYRPGPFWTRTRALIPPATLVAAYVLVRAWLGYGIAGSGFYIDPVTEPIRYLFAFRDRVLVLLADLLFSIPCEWSQGAPLPGFLEQTLSLMLPASSTQLSAAPVGLIAAVLVLVAIRWLRESRGGHGERAIEWLVVGALISLLPVGGVIAAGRMTPAPALGFDAFMAFLVWRSANAAMRASSRRRAVVASLSAMSLLAVALIVPARRSYHGAHYMNGMTNGERRWIEQADFGVESLVGRHVFVLSARDLASQIAIPYILHAAGKAMPASARLLSPRGDEPQVLTRVGASSFELAFAQHSSGTSFVGSVYRSDADVMHPGDKFFGPLFEVSVLETKLGQPTRVRFDFPISLDNEVFVFVVARQKQLVRLKLPPISGHFVIAPAGSP